MLLLKASNILDVFKPLNIFSQHFGLTSFSVKNHGGLLKTSVSCYNLTFILITTMWNCFCTYIFGSSLSDSKSDPEVFLSSVYQKSMFYVLLSFFNLSIASNWLIFFSREHISRSLNLMTQVDEKLEALSFGVNFKKHKLVVLLLILFTLSLTSFGVFITNLISNILDLFENGVLVLMSFWFCVELWLLIMLQFIFWIWMVQLRYEKINLFLQDFFLRNKKEYNRKCALKLNEAAEIHRKLVEVSECINHCYGFPVKQFLNL